MAAKRLLVFASGGKEPDVGGSGLLTLAERIKTGELHAQIVGVVSNYPCGGAHKKATDAGLRFIHFPAPWDEAGYQRIVAEFKPDLVFLSGWLKKVVGLPTEMVLNIHPGPLPEYGGKGMHGHHVHEAVLRDVKAGKRTCSEVSMHFTTAEFDKGPICFCIQVPASSLDTAETLGKRVNEAEHLWQWWVTDMVLGGVVRCINTNKGYKIQAPTWYLRSFVPTEWWYVATA